MAVGLSLRCVPTGPFQVSLLIAGPALEILVFAVGSGMSFSLASVAGVPVGTQCLLPLSLFECVSFPFAAAHAVCSQRRVLESFQTARCRLKIVHNVLHFCPF